MPVVGSVGASSGWPRWLISLLLGGNNPCDANSKHTQKRPARRTVLYMGLTFLG